MKTLVQRLVDPLLGDDSVGLRVEGRPEYTCWPSRILFWLALKRPTRQPLMKTVRLMVRAAIPPAVETVLAALDSMRNPT